MNIEDNETVTLYTCGNYKEITCCRHIVTPANITKLDKTRYINNLTGEIKEFQYSQRKTLDNFKKQFKHLPRLIKGYFKGDYTERFITLTYSVNMDNPYMLAYDFKKFMKKIERKYNKCRYIYVKEPNNQGSWHIHSIIKRLDEMPFNITVEIVRDMWKNGTEVSVEIPYNIDSIPYYFDITADENKKSRIIYYPSRLKIYCCSTDMKIEKTRGLYKDVKPTEMTKIYDIENQYIIVNQDDGEVTGQWKTAYEQYKKL